MEKTERNRELDHNWNADEKGKFHPEGEEPDRAFMEFQRAVESRLENAILERIESFRRELLKIKKAKR
ncbi:MAG: hypothetical protein PVG55_01515 [Nitrospirota bacterium]|jgi:hypothetical protein